MTIFGDLFGADQIDDALLDVLDTWMPTYLRAVSEDRGLKEPLAAPRSITVVSEFARFPEDQLPALVVVNPATGDTVARPGHYDATWPITVNAEAVAGTMRETKRNAALYLIAAREAILKSRSLGHGMKGVDWRGESYTLVDVDKRRSIAGATANFVIERERVAQIGGGPEIPDKEPYFDWPLVESVEVEVQKTD